MDISLISKLSVKSVKTWNTPDGGGYSCKLYCGDEFIADVYEAGQGGCAEYDQKCSDTLWKQIQDAIDALPQVKSEFGGDSFMLSKDLDWIVSDLVQEYQDNKRLKRFCKAGLCYKTADCGDNFYATKTPDSPRAREHYTTKCGAVEFLNDRFAA